MKFWFVLSLCFFACISCAKEPLPGKLAPLLPVQERVSTRQTFFQEGFTITPLATYEIQARVLGVRLYRGGEQNSLSPMDIAVGWGDMSDPVVYNRLRIKQSLRWYHYKWEGQPPIPATQIVAQSANMHLIPKNDEVLQKLRKINVGDVVRLRGQLVKVQKGAFRWISSLSRTDTGNGACELMYVEDIKTEFLAY